MNKPLYKRELSHSYLVIEGIPEGELGKYQYRMILRNRIPGLLTCSERFMEGKVCLYYDISSRQSLGRLYGSSKITHAQIRGIVDNLVQVQDTIAEYLLEESSLVLDPEYIYMDLETEQLLFLYHPFPSGENGRGSIYLPVAEFLLEHVDHREERAVHAAYQFYKMSKVESFTIESFRAILEKEETQERKGSVYMVGEEEGGSCFHEEEGMYAYQTSWSGTTGRGDGWSGTAAYGVWPHVKKEKTVRYGSMDNGKAFQAAGKEEQEPGGRTGDKEDVRKTGKGGGGKIGYVAGLACASLVFLSLCAAIWYLQPAGKGRICLFGVLAADGLLISAFLWKVIEGKGRMGAGKGNGAEEGRIEEFRETLDGDGMVAMETDGLSGPTVFLGAGKGQGEKGGPRLIEKGDADREYSLDRLPVMVGKMRSRVQLLLPDASVSRIHARFVEKEGRTALIDMNSTNGTYVNGIRLEQDETVILEDGDEVTFGNMELEYRE